MKRFDEDSNYVIAQSLFNSLSGFKKLFGEYSDDNTLQSIYYSNRKKYGLRSDSYREYLKNPEKYEKFRENLKEKVIQTEEKEVVLKLEEKKNDAFELMYNYYVDTGETSVAKIRKMLKNVHSINLEYDPAYALFIKVKTKLKSEGKWKG